ncbi:2-methylthioadenine synthetase [Ichthyobacterium seriolicida]|uniref:Threonylcarbamoyladenosine tRNA methylthiotransferase MtaB n=2 Tax=Ichthyobacterium seriolicida TaxID=242600 RepID=A0A1J1DWK3_9FLAO|nr:tRNA (N(6)-L-threonylcarbamoyladenosine(37)-C(2))-methylthiotransferase MtaB [Ichthyobacterium seriolicida]BAV94249.1 2-methylthioadenine synthetase [Ichthyobacterium seriolicida]
MNKVAFYTLGCKLNFSETSTISRDLTKNGYENVSFEDKADIYIINTCSVTENADNKFRSVVKSALKKNPNAFLIAIGCYAQLKPEEISQINGVDMVLGATEKFKILNYINDIAKKPLTEVHSCEIGNADFFVSSYSMGDKTRAFLKVQDGCDYKCTYCTIPLARGKSRSDTLESVINNAVDISNNGIKEIVLTGVNVGDFGKLNPGDKTYKNSFFELIQELDKVTGIDRVRISSIEPNLLKNEIIRFVSKSSKIVPHFHIPLQSGSDTILRRMKRRYLTNLYSKKIDTVKKIMPDACIGADVIVGFPGETEELFLETYNFILNTDISYLHVFSYSERDNTYAADNIKEVIPKEVRNKRSKMLRTLSAKKRRAFYESQLNKEFLVLFESENKSGFIHGFTENYVKVKTYWNPELVNTIHKVTLSKISQEGEVICDFI